ncbi:hypothetical protein QBC40DRAFT_296154 [Triangularia verruculosa]|uniref:CBM1 domain-containing protein n=1 Tax=Triangularia verruculosa TaxID=2587418 RepID=A0AAN6XLY3_9PEZI|nr:hypothetical protein QBC40DRAFT_296154 [Triangularia verruculosa]
MLTSLILSCLALSGTTLAQRGRPTTFFTVPSPSSPPRPGATQSLYGQCGGQNWTGATACPTGAYCKNDGNIWYSQCVANEPAQSPGNPAVTTKTITTVISVVGPTPTVVSTRITFLTPRPTSTTPSVVTVTLVPDDPCDHEIWC